MKKLIMTLMLMPMMALASLTDGLVAYYPFDGNANDASGNGNNGVVHGATLTADRFGNANGAYYFDGSSYIDAPNSSALYAICRTVSVSAWIKPEAWYPGDGYISFDKWLSVLNKGYNDRQFGIQIESDYGTKWLFSDNACIGSVSQLPTLDTWSHVVITDDGVIMTAWLNGQSIGTASSSGYLPQTTESLYIGMDRPAGLEYFIGAMDDIRIYNRALSAAEVKALYDGTSDPVVYTVTFDLNGADGAAPAERQIAEGAAVGPLLPNKIKAHRQS